ncbi:MAG TPA: chemotaxis protein CheD [Gammaproteobacteria bacterium]|jgi:chemotaxis protein CheD|nr:chemotaxis protein CheD [Gammaproteobacteria bacterium]
MSQKVVIVGEEAHSGQPDAILKTFALGSCVAIVLLDPATRVIGMVHVALPDSSVDPDKARDKPCYFVDSGVEYLLTAMSQAGCSPSGQGMVAKLAGGAAVMGGNDKFNVGGRNVDAARAYLQKKGIKIVAEDVGKNISRTATVHVGSAKVGLSSPGRDDWSI